MRSSRKIPMLLLVAALSVARGEPKKEPAGNEPQKPPAPAQKSARTDQRLDLPVPKGQPQKGLKIPIYDPESGKLQMNFEIGVATWVDDDNIKMGGLRIETFKRDGTSDLDVELPESVFNVKSRNVTSEGTVKLKREDFEITGGRMTFNTDTKRSTFGGGVRMLVYNLTADTAAQPGATATPVEPKPKTEEKK